MRVQGYEVDFFWRDHGLIFEVDGYAYHSSPAAFERDRRRDADLHDADFRVRRVTWKQLTEEPDAVAARLRRALGAGG